MNTFDEILKETFASISRAETTGKESKLSFRDVERIAAKEYAKQWVDRVVKEVADIPPNALIEMYHKEIDAQ